MATYTLDLPEGLAPDPLELDDGSRFHGVTGEDVAQGASQAGVSVLGEPMAMGDTAGALTEGALVALDDDADTLVVDVEPCTLAGVPAFRTLVVVQLGGLASVVVEQWRLVAGGARWVVTATADLAAWAGLGGALRAVVATFAVHGDGPAGDPADPRGDPGAGAPRPDGDA